MAGRIPDSDIARVRELSPVADVISEHVTLKSAGGGSLKGLCPFHDERSPSFNVTPARGFWHCFGCGEGGDVISFVQKIDVLSFSEAVEHLAARANYELHYEQGGSAPRAQQGQRARLVEAHKAAAEYFVEQLASAEAVIGRTFLTERGFDGAAAAHFGVGYAPTAGKTWSSTCVAAASPTRSWRPVAWPVAASAASSTGSAAGWSGRSVTSPATWSDSVHANFGRTTTGRSI